MYTVNPDDEAGTLRAYGYTDEQIASMGPKERAQEYRDALDAGVTPEPAGTGTRAEPIELKTADDVTRAVAVINQDQSPVQGEANNIQRAHVAGNGRDITLAEQQYLFPKSVFALMPGGYVWQIYGFWRGAAAFIVIYVLLVALGHWGLHRDWSRRRFARTRIALIAASMLAIGLSAAETCRISSSGKPECWPIYWPR